MTTARTRPILAVGFLASLLTAGLPYWLMPYPQLNLPDALYGPGLLVLALAAAVARVYAASGFWKSILILAGSLPAIVMARIIVEAGMDPTSHNLWPLEIVIASALGIVCASAGASTGAMLGWAIARASAGR